MAKGKVLSAEEQVVEHESALAQAQRQIAGFEERIKQLVGYQQEAQSARPAIEQLQADLEEANVRAIAAEKEAARATAAAKDAAARSSAGGKQVSAALELVAALKKLG